MNNDLVQLDTINYRVLYGKLFSALLNQFGANNVAEIEDAIQNTFLKSLKVWKQDSEPSKKENWLFIVARNDLLNHIKKKQKQQVASALPFYEHSEINTETTDLRLQTVIFIATLKSISTQAKITFVLKNIFGLSITDINTSTLLNNEAIYKSINRTKTIIKNEFGSNKIDIQSISANDSTVKIVEEILYAIFNIGFDSFSEKQEEIVNKDLCLEAFSLSKLLYHQYQLDSTSNLLSLFCFHAARIPAKIENGKLISFFNQNRERWNTHLFQLGFHYLKQPNHPNKFWIEAVIISKYMTVPIFTEKDWDEIVSLYEILLQVSQSPITKLNYCFCLSKVGKIDKALKILKEIKYEFPEEHIYFNLVKARLLKDVNPCESHQMFISVMANMNQTIRKDFILESELKHL